jgi:Holliday junction DNA helicase RuvA
MISRLSGQLIDASLIGDRLDVTVDVAGVGYRVIVHPALRPNLGELNRPCTLWIHTHVREDQLSLYGFLTLDERTLFETLVGAHGVGPSLALAILATLRPHQLRLALATDDVGALCAVPGVGKKTAQRLLIELKSKLVTEADLDLTGGDPTTAAVLADMPGDAVSELRAALSALGYTTDEIREAIALAREQQDAFDDADTPVRLRATLRALAGRRG